MLDVAARCGMTEEETALFVRLGEEGRTREQERLLRGVRARILGLIHAYESALQVLDYELHDMKKRCRGGE